MSTSTELTDPDLFVLDASAGALQSVGTIVGLTRTLLQKTPSQFVSSHGLAQLLGGFQNTYNELTAYQSDKNVAHIQNAKANIEQGVMPFLWAFASLPTEDNAGQVVDLVNQVSRSAAEAIEQVLSRRNQYAEKIDEFSRQIQTVQTQIEAHAQIIAQQKAEVGAAVAVIQKENTEREIQQVTSFEALLKQFKESFDSTHENAHVAQEEILLALRNNQTDAARIVQVVGNIGTTGNYQKIANLEGSQANLWRRVTIFFFLLGITLAAATFVKFWYVPFSPESAWSATIRLLYAIVITTPAWYAARESARHRTNSDRARQTELELASLGPFIELMPDEMKHKIRQELTPRYFGRSIAEHSVRPPI